jgi:hypothetical protein
MIANREVLQAAESLPSAPPSERDLEIFAAVKVDCRRQVDVAAEFGISQSRVSQICRDVKLWRAGMGIGAELEGRDQKVVEAWLDAQRLENLYEHTLELFRRSCQPKRRERKGANQHGEWHAETIDHPPGNLQCLRLASRLIELRWKMEEKCPQPSQQALARADESTLLMRLISMRHWAEVLGEVHRGEEPGKLVMRLLDELLGRGANTAGQASSGTQPAGQITAGHASSGTQPGVGGQESGVGSRDTQTATTGRGYAEPAAHTAHIISAAAATYESANDAVGGAVNDWQDVSCVEGTGGSSSPGNRRGAAEKSVADMSGQNTAGQASRGTQSATTDRGYAEEERLALAELRRTFAVEIWPSMADHSLPNLLAEGQANLLLQGYTREQRQALLGWQRVIELRREERGARSQGTFFVPTLCVGNEE